MVVWLVPSHVLGFASAKAMLSDFFCWERRQSQLTIFFAVCNHVFCFFWGVFKKKKNAVKLKKQITEHVFFLVGGG